MSLQYCPRARAILAGRPVGVDFILARHGVRTLRTEPRHMSYKAV